MWRWLANIVDYGCFLALLVMAAAVLVGVAAWLVSQTTRVYYP